MNTTTQSRPSDLDDDLMCRLLAAIDDGEDPASVEARFIAECPERAEEIQRVIAAHRLMGAAGTTRPQEPPAPDRLGDFTIRGRLGVGGMGVVYLAYQGSLKRLVALKTIRADDGRISEEADRRFQREWEVLARLQHEGIVPVFAAGEEGGLRYYAMKYVPGLPLNRLVRTARWFESSTPDKPLPSLAHLANGSAPSTNGSATASQTNAKGPESNADAVALPAQVTLSAEYVRSVARVMRDVADALRHAHGEGVLHRDLKPSNIMVDAKERSALLDFGLASLQRREAPEGDDPGTDGASASDTRTSGGVKGTPQYMAPEAFQGEADVRTDIYGLGVTFYELLTLRPPFAHPEWKALRELIRNESPVPIRRLAKGVPADVSAICQKAMAKRPEDRYQTAEDLSEDLGRWMNGEPTKARPARAPRRAWMWSKRNKGWAAAIALAALLTTGFPAAGFILSHEREQAKDRRLRVLDIQREVSGDREGGWSDKILAQIHGMGVRQEDRLELQGLAVAALTGLDAHEEKHFELYARSLAFSGDGRLWLGDTDTGVKRWGPDSDLLETWKVEVAGPIAVRPDGAVRQLGPTYPGPDRVGRLPVDPRPGPAFPLRVLDVEKQAIIRSYADPFEGGSRLLAWTISPEGARVAASVLDRDGGQWVVIWDGGGEGPPLRIACRRSPESPAVSRPGLVFSPDARVLGTWDGSGRVGLWGVSDGASLASFQVRHPVTSVAFGKNHWANATTAKVADRWMVAVGDANGTVTLWEPSTASIWRLLHTGVLEVMSLAFSPDGTLLASAGRTQGQVWDVASGLRLLGLVTDDYCTALAFSPDGQHLASSCWRVFAPRGREPLTRVFRLVPDRGIRHLHGMPGPVVKLVFSQDGRRVAALSWDWWAGVWERSTGRLVRLISLPRGQFADNATLAFGPGGDRLATATGNTAALWDLTGGPDRLWSDLPWGLQEAILFRDEDHLMLMRVEVEDGSRPPDSEAPAGRFPRVCVLRDLLSADPRRPLRVIDEFRWGVPLTMAVPGEGLFVIGGVPGGPKRSPSVSVRVCDHQGTPLVDLPFHWPSDQSGRAWSDPGGKLLVVCQGGSSRHEFYELPTGRYLGRVPIPIFGLAPNARFLLNSTTSPLSLHDRDGRVLVERIAMTPVSGLDQRIPFSPDLEGRFLLWGDASGIVCLMDLVELRRRLNSMGLGW